MNGTQSKMARAALGLSTHELARLAGVGRITVVRFEDGGSVADETRAKLENALADAGAQFSRRASRVGVTVPE
jgi:transcriptional regulator with XRE-family HTH domain